MKIKYIKGIAEKLEAKRGTFLTSYGEGFDNAISDILDTDIKLEDIVEIDAWAVKKAIFEEDMCSCEGYENVIKVLGSVIAKSNCIKWKETK